MATKALSDRRKLTFDKVSFMAVFLGVPLLIFIVFMLVPYVQSLYYSMTDWGGFSADMDFVGFANFAKLTQDATFLKALRNSAILGATVPTITIVLAFAISYAVTLGGPSIGKPQPLAGSGFYRVITFFPYCVPGIVIGLIWSAIYDPRTGLLNGILTSLGISSAKDFAWLGQQSTAMPASIVVVVWAFVGFYTILFVAAIKGIPGETLEAARIDGAGRLKTAWSVVLPQMTSNIQTAYIYLGLTAMDSFTFLMALNPTGGPDYATLTLSQLLYVTAFKKGQFGYATSIGITFAIMTLIYALIIFLIFWALRREPRGNRSAK